jgi:hypothetical protein
VSVLDPSTTAETDATAAATRAPASAGATSRGGAGPDGRPGARARALRAGRLGTVVVLVIGLLTAGLSRMWAMALQERAEQTGPSAGGVTNAGRGATLAGLDSFTLALLLGGLRGPLVMFLWVSSEAQKNEKDLEAFDTKVELIRLLQPEFDTVHLFQIWNKAYNISAQLPSLPHKYAVILDALDYAKNVDAERPNDLNILAAMGALYSDKLGGAIGDKEYYIRRVREDTRYRPEVSGPRRARAARQRHDSILDPDGNLRPGLVRALRPRPDNLVARIVVPADLEPALRAAAREAGVALPPAPEAGAADTGGRGSGRVRRIVLNVPQGDADKLRLLYYPAEARYIDADWITGAELQGLERYQPYPDGLSPQALGYAYTKRAQLLMALTGQRPLQSSTGVVDSRPGLALRDWAEEEWQRAIEAELRAFGKEIPSGRQQMEIPTADIPLATPPVAPSEIDLAMYHYQMTVRVARDAKAEYTRHLLNPENYINKYMDYSSHIDHLSGAQFMAAGDYDFLRAMKAASPAERRAALEQAAIGYRNAITWYQHMDLKYYIPQEYVQKFYPPGFTRADLDKLRIEAMRFEDISRASEMSRATMQLGAIHVAALTQMRGAGASQDDVEEYLKNINRASARTKQIAQVLAQHDAAPPATQPSSAEDTPAGGTQ